MQKILKGRYYKMVNENNKNLLMNLTEICMDIEIEQEKVQNIIEYFNKSFLINNEEIKKEGMKEIRNELENIKEELRQQIIPEIKNEIL